MEDAREALAELEEVEMPSNRNSKRLSANLVIMDEDAEETSRPKIEKIEEQVLSLELEVALLEAKNNRYEHEQLNFGDDMTANANLSLCIDTLAELKSFDAKLSEATEVFMRDLEQLA